MAGAVRVGDDLRAEIRVDGGGERLELRAGENGKAQLTRREVEDLRTLCDDFLAGRPL